MRLPATDSKIPASNDEVLAEMLREAEKIVDHQVQAIEEMDDKAEQMIGIGIGTLGGGLALAAFLADRTGVTGIVAPYSAVAIPLSLSVAAILFFLESYIGILNPRSAAVGPDLRWIREKSNDSGWGLKDHYLSVLAAYPNFYDANMKKMEHSVTWRRRGLFVLMIAVASYAVGAYYILSQRIGAD